MRSFSLLLLLTACGGSKSSPTPEAQPVADVPALDCQALLDRVNTCEAEFVAAYAQTNDGKRKGGGDGAAGAETLMNVMRPGANQFAGLETCQNTWAKGKDARWSQRLADCSSKSDCADWGPCVATAIGSPLPPPQ
jgi:hypothetical protein